MGTSKNRKKGMSERKVDISLIDLDKEKDKITDLPGLIEYAHHAGSAIIKPEDKGRIKGNAVASMHDQTDRQFRQLYEQMQTLIEQASVPFQPVVGTIYFLFKKKDGSDVLSLVGPEEWGKSFPYESFEAEVRLLSDHTWEIVKTTNQEYSY